MVPLPTDGCKKKREIPLLLHRLVLAKTHTHTRREELGKEGDGKQRAPDTR
jgi:hypothetical protein